jgi:3-dehydroquinate dehydratase/shikimate dehydrogenase
MAQRTLFPPICIALGFPDVDSLLSHARAEYLAGERFLEFRLDYLSDPERGIAGMKRFLTRHPDCTILATCRRRQNQGKFTGSIEEQLQILDAAREAGAHAVDLEIESAENCEERLADLRASTYLLLSYHNYGGTPPRLDNVLRRMTRIPAHGYKVVTTARKPSDTSRLHDSAGDGRNRIRHPRALAVAWGAVHVRRAQHGRRDRLGSGERQAATGAISRGKILA